MTEMATDRGGDTGSRPWLRLAGWTGAAAAVCAVHAGAVWLAVNWQPAAAAAGEPPSAIMIELSPVSVAPEAPPQDVAPGPQMTQAEPAPIQPETEPEVERTPVEDTPPPPPPPEPEIRIPELPPMPDAAAVLTPPPPPPKPQVERPPPPRPVQRVERPRPVRPDRARVRQTTAPPTAQTQRADTAAAPSAGAAAASAASQANWRSSLMAHLNRFKRAPPGATSGVVQVAFTIDRSGRVLSSRLVRGSGDSALDNEAVSMMRRASPVPAPPASVAGSSISFSVPVRFNR